MVQPNWGFVSHMRLWGAEQGLASAPDAALARNPYEIMRAKAAEDERSEKAGPSQRSIGALF
jgi:hypothetical protein